MGQRVKRGRKRLASGLCERESDGSTERTRPCCSGRSERDGVFRGPSPENPQNTGRTWGRSGPGRELSRPGPSFAFEKRSFSAFARPLGHRDPEGKRKTWRTPWKGRFKTRGGEAAGAAPPGPAPCGAAPRGPHGALPGTPGPVCPGGLCRAQLRGGRLHLDTAGRSGTWRQGSGFQTNTRLRRSGRHRGLFSLKRTGGRTAVSGARGRLTEYEASLSRARGGVPAARRPGSLRASGSRPYGGIPATPARRGCGESGRPRGLP